MLDSEGEFDPNETQEVAHKPSAEVPRDREQILRGGSTAKAPREVFPRIDGYRIERIIGRGGMGVVYEAVQEKLGRQVAIKLLPAVMSSANPDLIDRFRHEATNVSKLHHAHIIPVFDFGESRDGYYFVMELLHGRTLSTIIKKLGALDMTMASPTSISAILDQPDDKFWHGYSRSDEPIDTMENIQVDSTTGRDRVYYRLVATWMADSADALHYAHTCGMIHRDVKPGNLMVCSDGRIMLLDFGLVKTVDDTAMTQTGSLLGSYRYMSPEQAGGNRVPLDARTDEYSLGATMYELLAFQPVFSTTDQTELLGQIMFKEPTPPKKIIPSIPPDLQTICLKALEKSPADRYASAKAMADDLHLFLRDMPITAKRPGPAGRAVRFVRRHRAGSAIASITLLLAVATFFAVSYQRKEFELRVGSLLSAGIHSWLDHEWEDAAESFEELLDLDPQNFRGLVNFAAARKDQSYATGDEQLLAQADQLVTRAILIDPNRKEGWNMRGIIRRVRGDYEGAVRDLKKATELDPEYYPILVNLASVHALQGHLEQAEARLLESLPLGDGSKSNMVYRHLAAVQLQMGKTPEAMDRIERALILAYRNEKEGKADTTDVESLLLKSKIFLHAGGQVNHHVAFGSALAADAISPDHGDPRIKRFVALTNLRLGNWSAARQAAQAAQNLQDEPSYVLLLLAIAESHLGDTSSARHDFDEAMDRWPEDWEQAGFTVKLDAGFLWFEDIDDLIELRREAEQLLDK